MCVCVNAMQITWSRETANMKRSLCDKRKRRRPERTSCLMRDRRFSVNTPVLQIQPHRCGPRQTCISIIYAHSQKKWLSSKEIFFSRRWRSRKCTAIIGGAGNLRPSGFFQKLAPTPNRTLSYVEATESITYDERLRRWRRACTTRGKEEEGDAVQEFVPWSWSLKFSLIVGNLNEYAYRSFTRNQHNGPHQHFSKLAPTAPFLLLYLTYIDVTDALEWRTVFSHRTKNKR